MERESIKDYFADIKRHLDKDSADKTDIIFDNQSFLNNKECYYIFDLSKGEMIEHNGFDKLLGYSKDEISYDLMLDCYHKDDIDIVLRVSKTTISHCIKYPSKCTNSLLQMSYRFKKKDGSYIKILSQSTIYKTNAKGEPTQTIAKLTDISFLDNYDYVNWTFHCNDFTKRSFSKNIYKEFENFISPREKQVIIEMYQGLTNKEIAVKLSISKETVATHRKNIFRKTNIHNINDLVLFCKRNGIL